MQAKFYKTFFIAVFSVLAVVLLNRFLLNNFLQNLVYGAVAKPGAFFVDELAKLPRFARVFWKAGVVVAENKKLKQENIDLLGRSAAVEGLERENDLLRSQLQVSKKQKPQLLMVKIFAIEKGPLSSVAFINKGAADGVKKTMPIIGGGNVLVGIIDQVFDQSAIVLLVDDPRVKISVRTQGTGILADTKGELAGNFSLGMITSKDEIKEGDIMVTNGLDGLAESLLVGRISKVELTGGDLFKKVSGKSLFDPSLGSSLFVILNQEAFRK
jgi:rod shape-determining protein MreC